MTKHINFRWVITYLSDPISATRRSPVPGCWGEVFTLATRIWRTPGSYRETWNHSRWKPGTGDCRVVEVRYFTLVTRQSWAPGSPGEKHFTLATRSRQTSGSYREIRDMRYDMTKRVLMMTKHRPADSALLRSPGSHKRRVITGILLLWLPGVRECQVVTVQGFTFVSRRSKTRSIESRCVEHLIV